MLYQLFIPCSDQIGCYAIEHTLQGEYSDVSLLAIVRNVIDGHRTITHGTVAFHGACLVERDTPLSARSKMRVYSTPDIDRLSINDPFRGLARGMTQGRFVELWAQRGVLSGEPHVCPIRHAVTDADLYPLWGQEALSLDPKGPLWSLRFPLFANWINSIPGLDEVKLQDAGQPIARNLRGGYKPAYAVYKWKLHCLEQTRPPHGELFKRDLLEYLRSAQKSAIHYEGMMEAFSGNWGDNHTPNQFRHYDAVWSNAIAAASVWHAVAIRIGLTNVPVCSILPGARNDIDIHSGVPLDQVQAVPLRSRFALVKQICERLYQCQRTMETACLQLENTTAYKAFKEVVLQGRALWFTEIETSGGNPRRKYFRSDPNENTIFDGVVTGFIHSRCFEQHGLEDAWQESGGAAFAALYYNLFPAMSAALFEILSLLTLLPCVFDVAGTSAKAFEDAGFERTKIETFPRRDSTPDDFLMGGAACDFVQFVPWSRGAFRSVVHACRDEVVSLRYPKPPIPQRPFPYNPTTDPDPRDNAFEAWKAGDLARAASDVRRDQAALYRKWDRAVNSYIDTLIPPVAF